MTALRLAASRNQGDVFLVAMVMVVGDVAGGAVTDFPRRVRVCVPDRWAFAVLVPCALDLVCPRWPCPKGNPWGIRARQSAECRSSCLLSTLRCTPAGAGAAGCRRRNRFRHHRYGTTATSLTTTASSTPIGASGSPTTSGSVISVMTSTGRRTSAQSGGVSPRERDEVVGTGAFDS